MNKYENAMELDFASRKILSIINLKHLKSIYHIGTDTKIFLIMRRLLPNWLLNKIIIKQYGF